MKRALLAALTLVSCSPHHYTCAEIIGTVPGEIAVLPPGWSAELRIDSRGAKAVGRVLDDKGRLVCDAEGKDVR